MTTLTLTLPDDQARRLRARATDHDLSLEDYVLRVVEKDALSHEEWRERLHALPRLLGKKLPTLSEEAYSRESMYRD